MARRPDPDRGHVDPRTQDRTRDRTSERSQTTAGNTSPGTGKTGAGQPAPSRTTMPDGTSQPMRVADLSGRAAHRFRLAPGPEARAALAGELDLDALPALRFTGALHPEGRRDWRLEARLEARVVQPCVVTLAPVTTAIATDVLRHFRADWQPPSETEAEMPDDDTEEPLGAVIDPGVVMREALALALPLYPRAAGAGLGEAVFAPPGAEPLRDGDLRPLAGLAALRDKLGKDT
jgi:uncharacterized metal-binding protein YceD (DUF177 family)